MRKPGFGSGFQEIDSQTADIKIAHAMWRELNPPAKKPAREE